MPGISKVAVGSALVVAVSLTLVLLLLLLLYVELCCSLLWHRRLRSPPLPITPPQREQGAATAAGDGQKGQGTPGSPFDKLASPSAAAYHAPGVLQTPPSFFFATISEPAAALRKQDEISPPLRGKTGFHLIGLVPSPCSATKGDAVPSGMDGGRSWISPPEHFVCISNPIYDGACGTGAGDDEEDSTTPFETPDTSPSRLEVDDDDEEEDVREQGEGSPALKPMKKLPPVLPLGTSAAFLADGRRSLATSISVTDTNRPSSSSSSNSTSPSTSLSPV